MLNLCFSSSLLIFIIASYTQTKQTTEIIALNGNLSLGYYYITAYVGFPQQTQRLIPDFQDSLLLVTTEQCGLCKENMTFPLYDKQKSMTSHALHCSDKLSICQCLNKANSVPCRYFSIGEGSYNGYMIEDQISFKQKHNNQNDSLIQFACITSLSTSFNLQENGFLGLARGPYNILNDYFQKKYQEKYQKFSLCFGGNGGNFKIGDFDNNQQSQIKFQMSTNYYKLKGVDNITIGNESLTGHTNPNDKGITITTAKFYNSFPKYPHKKVIIFFQDKCKEINCQVQQLAMKKNQDRFNVTCLLFNQSFYQTEEQIVNNITQFPSFYYNFSRHTFQWKTEQYLPNIQKIFSEKQIKEVEQINKKTIKPNLTFCLCIQKGQDYSVGFVWLQNKQIIIDNNNNLITIQENVICDYREEIFINHIGLFMRILSMTFFLLLFIFIFCRNILYMKLCAKKDANLLVEERSDASLSEISRDKTTKRTN